MNGQARLKKEVLQAIGINKSIGNKDDIITKKVSELLNNNRALKARLFVDSLIEGARKEYGLYHQRKMDLIARLSTEWPTWGIGLDFFHNIIFPFTKNTIVQHFINLSERFDLGKTFHEIYVLPKNFNINNLEKYKVKIWYKKNNQSIEIKNLVDLTYLSFLEEWDEDLARNFRIGFEYNHSFLVKVIDADVGVQAIYTILEGILRNSAKHGRDNTNEMRVKIIFAENKAIVSKLLDDGDLKDDDCYYMLISCGKDVEDDNLVSKLNSYLSERIIDEGGKPTPGNWGMKEIKICSAFVNGENIETLNEESVDYIKIAKSSKIWKNEESRLVYVLKLQKPRYLLVWTDDFPSNIRNYEKFGIKFVKDLDPPKMRWQDLDYDFLVVNKQQNGKKVKETVETHKVMLPQRVIFLNTNYLLSDRLLFGTYEEWCKKLSFIKGKNFKVGCYFENGKENDWKTLNDSNFMFFLGPEEIDNTIKCQPNPPNIYLLRHRKFEKIKSFFLRQENINQEIPTLEQWAYYYQYGTARDPFCSLVFNIDPKSNSFLAKLLMYQFLESAILKILVIDERIAQTINNKRITEEDISLIEKLKWMGIYIVEEVKINGQTPDGLKFIESQSDGDDKEDLYWSLEINEDGEITNFKENFKENIDIIFIHQTKLNLILKNLGIERESLIEKWRKRDNLNRWVIIHSGRGKPIGEKPENAPFLEFSTLERYIVYEPSKFYLVQIALGLKDRGGE